MASIFLCKNVASPGRAARTRSFYLVAQIREMEKPPQLRADARMLRPRQSAPRPSEGPSKHVRRAWHAMPCPYESPKANAPAYTDTDALEKLFSAVGDGRRTRYGTRYHSLAVKQERANCDG